MRLDPKWRSPRPGSSPSSRSPGSHRCRGPSGPRFSVTYGADKSAEPLDGRLLLMLSTDPSRRAAHADQRLDPEDAADLRRRRRGLEGRRAGASIEGDVLGYPVESLAAIPPGTYQVQALLHRYETFHRADGHVVKLPMDRGEGQQWSKAPGNLYSTPREITIEAGKAATFAIELDQVIPPIPDPPHDEVRQARADPERAADEVLGPPDVPRRARPPARGLRRAPGRALSARHLPRPLPATRSTASARRRPTRT